MPTISTKRRAAQPKPDAMSQLMEPGATALNTPDPAAPAPEPAPATPTANTTNTQVDVSALLTQIAELKTQMGEFERERIASLTQITPPAPSAPPAPKGFDLAGLPDPTTDPDGYVRTLNERINRTIDERVQHQQTLASQAQAVAAQQGQRYEQLQEAFILTYPDYAEDEDRMEFAARKVIDAARARGIDPERYVFQYRDRFMADVVAQYDEIFGKPGEEEPATGPEPVRTSGMFGGVESGSRPPASPRQDQPGSLLSELKETQRKLGLW